MRILDTFFDLFVELNVARYLKERAAEKKMKLKLQGKRGVQWL